MLLRAMLQGWFEPLRRFFLHNRFGRALALLTLPLALLALALWEPDRLPPIFDAQVHYNEDAWMLVSPKAILGTARKYNVPQMLVSSTPNEGTFRLAERDPERVIPMFVPYGSSSERDTWFENHAMMQIMETELARGRYRGIGEFHLFDGQVETPVVRRMVQLAAEHRLVLSAHSDANAVRQLFTMNPAIRILWAHAGMTTTPATIGEMLGRYPNLWAELSHRTDVAPRGELAQEWRELLLRHPDRFLLGSGTYSNEYWHQFRITLDRYRDWLQTLPPEVAERIAYHNGAELFAAR